MDKYAIFIDGQGKTDMLEERVLFERSPLSFSVRAFVYLQKEVDDQLAAKDSEIAALRAQLEKADALAEIVQDLIDAIPTKIADEAVKALDAYKEARHG